MLKQEKSGYQKTAEWHTGKILAKLVMILFMVMVILIFVYLNAHGIVVVSKDPYMQGTMVATLLCLLIFLFFYPLCGIYHTFMSITLMDKHGLPMFQYLFIHFFLCITYLGTVLLVARADSLLSIIV